MVRTDAQAYLRARKLADHDVLAELILTILPSAVFAILGCRPYLFNEHFVAKPARVATSFCWHTDAAHQLEALLALSPPCTGAANASNEEEGGNAHEYVSLWIPLDDISESNGALILLPRDASLPSDGTRAAPPPPWHQPANDDVESWFSTHGTRTRASVTTAGLGAGDAVLFSSRLWHCSEPNRSEHDRRVYYAQYSRRPIGSGQGAACPSLSPLSLAVPTTPGHLPAGVEMRRLAAATGAGP